MMSEADLCAEFVVWAKAKGYRVYPEVNDWDIILEPARGSSDLKPIGGEQIGVQAKLKANIAVLEQCLWNGPEVRVVLVPWASREFRTVAKHLNLFVVTKFMDSKCHRPHCSGFDVHGLYHKWTDKKFWVPPIETNRPCGVQSPQSLTPWKVKALKLINLFDSKGFLTSADFKTFGVSITIWVQAGWLVPVGKAGRLTQYVLGKFHPGLGWEKEKQQIKDVESCP